MSTIEVVLNRAELFFASVLETRQSRHPHSGSVHTVFLLSWDLVLGLDRGVGASNLFGPRPDGVITRSVHPIRKLLSCARLERSGGRIVGGGLQFVLRLSGLMNEAGLLPCCLSYDWNRLRSTSNFAQPDLGTTTTASTSRAFYVQVAVPMGCRMLADLSFQIPGAFPSHPVVPPQLPHGQ